MLMVSKFSQINFDSSKGLTKPFPKLLRMKNLLFFCLEINGGTVLNKIMSKSTSLVLNRARWD